MRTIFSSGLLCGALLWALAATTPATAREIESVSIPETLTVPGSDTPLLLNGAGIRKKFFVKVYIGALYLPKKESGANAIISMPGAKSIRMHFLYKEVESEKLVETWTDGFRNNNSENEYSALAARLEQFNKYFRAVRRGETIRLDLLPNDETRVFINDELRGTIAGTDFQRALLKIWLGEKPADSDLKRAVLGASD